jgi:hypothetical protein
MKKLFIFLLLLTNVIVAQAAEEQKNPLIDLKSMLQNLRDTPDEELTQIGIAANIKIHFNLSEIERLQSKKQSIWSCFFCSKLTNCNGYKYADEYEEGIERFSTNAVPSRGWTREAIISYLAKASAYIETSGERILDLKRRRK